MEGSINWLLALAALAVYCIVLALAAAAGDALERRNEQAWDGVDEQGRRLW